MYYCLFHARKFQFVWNFAVEIKITCLKSAEKNDKKVLDSVKGCEY